MSCHPCHSDRPPCSPQTLSHLKERGEVTVAGSGSGKATARVRGTAWEEGQKKSDGGYPLRPNTHVGTMGFWASSTTVVLS